MRRFKQQLPVEDVERILHHGKYAVWAVSGDDDYPYAVPVNYVYDGNANAIYIHCAVQGHKLDSIKRNPKCSLCIVEKDDVVPQEFTSYFRSVIAFGKAHIVQSQQEVLDALHLLCDKYSPGVDPTDEIARFLRVVCIVRVDIDSVTGKEAKELMQQR